MASPNRFCMLFAKKKTKALAIAKFLLCIQMCQYSRVFQKGDTPLPWLPWLSMPMPWFSIGGCYVVLFVNIFMPAVS